jgi:hypothetical protein
VLGIGDPAPASRLDHRRCEVGGDHPCAAGGERLGQVAGASREVEDRVARLRPEGGEERGRDRRIRRGEAFALRFPRARRGIPTPPDLFRRLYAATPLN